MLLPILHLEGFALILYRSFNELNSLVHAFWNFIHHDNPLDRLTSTYESAHIEVTALFLAATQFRGTIKEDKVSQFQAVVRIGFKVER
jgi:hypothetical protein